MLTETDLDHAIAFAATAHTGQRRKYTNEPYVTHCIEVMNIVRTAGGSIEMQCAAVLHDTIEDTYVSYSDLHIEFGENVAEMVLSLSDMEEGNRATRKRLSCERLAAASGNVQTIKLADLISNTASITEHDPKFAAVYLKEKATLLRAMTKGNVALWNKAAKLIPDEYWP